MSAEPTIARIFDDIARLKKVKREGWLQRGIPRGDCESVADHSYGTALLVLLLGRDRDGLDLDRALRMALLHDLAEARVGDMVPGNGIPTEEKHRLEAEAMAELLAGLPGDEALLSTWHEYERGETAESRFVRQVDKVEMAMQSAVYGASTGLDLDEFEASARTVVDDPELVAILDELTTPGARESGG